jgi:putative ubiquitin-RnfH superfamily antitoxin RatB of RatAB toxin-antitoxin module
MSVFKSTGSVLRDLRNVQIHGFITFSTSVVLHETRSTALDLDTASSFLLNVFDVGTTLTDNLSTEVEANDRLEIYGNLLLGPLALKNRLEGSRESAQKTTYTTHGISLDLFWFSAAEASFIYKVR